MEAVRPAWKIIPELEKVVNRRKQYVDGLRTMRSMAQDTMKTFNHVKEDDMTHEQMT